MRTDRPRRRHRRWVLISALAAAATLGLTGCGGGDDGGDAGGAFAVAPVETYPLPCLEHQPEIPGPAYTSGADADTRAILAMLRYYTANKSVTEFCDGKPPTDRDRAWARLYVDLGADSANVTHLLG